MTTEETEAADLEELDDEPGFDPGAGGPIVRSRSVRVAAVLVIALGGGAILTAFVATLIGDPQRGAPDPGRLSEVVWAAPETVPALSMSDRTQEWRLHPSAGRSGTGDLDPMTGGLTSVDADRDGDLDLIVAYGSLRILLWDGTGFVETAPLQIVDAMAVTAADVDQDGWIDLLVARDAPNDTVIWGGDWLANGGTPQSSDLPGAEPSSALLAAELSGDDAIDILRLGRGNDSGAPDILWTADPNADREFTPIQLGADERLSLAGELVDVDLDGLLDVWVTRDVGWDTGPDSVYSRQGDPAGPWVDIGPEIGADLAIDGMGVTVADLDGDADLDAYVSDLGDNEVLLRGPDRFDAAFDTGAARIRPPDSATSMISSSWASGAADLNLDGRLDLVVANGGFPSGGMRNKVPFTTIAVEDSPSVLIGIGGGRYVDAWPELGIDWATSSRGLTIGDYDADGDDDLIFLADDGALRAFRNEASGPSLTIRPESGCDATGTIVTTRQADLIFQSLLRAHTYGGAHSAAMTIGTPFDITAIEIQWPGAKPVQLRPPSGTGRTELIVGCGHG